MLQMHGRFRRVLGVWKRRFGRVEEAFGRDCSASLETRPAFTPPFIRSARHTTLISLPFH
eukprot:357296-Chlamydomonas_euryale.AAC.3